MGAQAVAGVWSNANSRRSRCLIAVQFLLQKKTLPSIQRRLNSLLTPTVGFPAVKPTSHSNREPKPDRAEPNRTGYFSTKSPKKTLTLRRIQKYENEHENPQLPRLYIFVPPLNSNTPQPPTVQLLSPKPNSLFRNTVLPPIPMGEPTQGNLPSTSLSPMIISPKTNSSLGHTYLRTPDRNKIYDRMNPNVGIFDEQVLTLVFRHLNWDPQALCSTACTSHRMRAVAERILFFKLCLSRAPRLTSSLVVLPHGSQRGGVVGSSPRVPGRWGAVAKLLLFCCGCVPSKFFSLSNATKGHFTPVSRFSKTSGKSFLVRRCWGDNLYVSDPCEHASPAGEEDDLGVYRGVFGAFMKSRTRACLIGRNVQLEVCIKCPYCGARVWSMTAAGLVPRSASRRLGTHEDSLEYFVCLNGHLHGSCWLVRLSDDGDDEDKCKEDNQVGDEIMA